MCKAVNDYAKRIAEEYTKQKAVEIVKNMLDDGFDIEKALKYAKIDLQTYEKYSESAEL